jgi:putative hydrolase of the HAD superfamily
LEYWFSGDVELDEEVLAVAQTLRQKGIECYLATDQEKYRKEYLMQRLEGTLDGFWFSCDLGCSKDKPEFFKEILAQWEDRFKPEDIAYWDDDQKNVAVAKALGIDAHFYTTLEDFKNNIQN